MLQGFISDPINLVEDTKTFSRGLSQILDKGLYVHILV